MQLNGIFDGTRKDEKLENFCISISYDDILNPTTSTKKLIKEANSTKNPPKLIIEKRINLP